MIQIQELTTGDIVFDLTNHRITIFKDTNMPSVYIRAKLLWHTTHENKKHLFPFEILDKGAYKLTKDWSFDISAHHRIDNTVIIRDYILEPDISHYINKEEK